MEKEEKLFLALAQDKAVKCRNKNILTETNFLDLHQQSLLLANQKNMDTPPVLWGGYADAERKIAVFLPDYLDEPSESLLCVIRVTTKNSARLTHRDYLGSVLGTGIKREQIGDIVVDAQGAFVLAKAEIGEFICQNLIKIGRENASCTLLSLSELQIFPAAPKAQLTVSVNSLRLDKITADAFKIFRTDASGFILAGRVFVNQKEVLKPDFILQEGDTVTLRGKGKAKLSALLGQSKKGKQRLTIEIY